MEDERCIVCNANLTKQTAMERHIHINRCLDKTGPDAPIQENVEVCPVCTMELARFTIEERNQHVLECVEGREAIEDFEDSRDGAVIQAFESSITGTVDITSNDFQCWMCAKPLARLSVKTRFLHLADCTRIPKEILESIFVIDDASEQDGDHYRIKSKGLTPQEIVQKLESVAKAIDRQIVSLNMYRQKLQVQMERALTLLPSEPKRKTSKRQIAGSTNSTPAVITVTDVSVAAISSASLPAMKPSTFGSAKSKIKHDAGPESFPDDEDARLLAELADDSDAGIASEHRHDEVNFLSNLLTQTQKE